METIYVRNEIEDLSCNDQPIPPVQTMIFSSQSLVVKGIRALLKHVSSVKLVGHATTSVELMLRIHETNPKLVIINDDIQCEDTNTTIEKVRMLAAEVPNIDMLMLMAKADFAKELGALKLGVKGVVIKNFEREILNDSIKRIVNGGLWFRREVMEKFIREQLLLNKCSGGEGRCFKAPSFTRRELEIIHLAAKGRKNREIGDRLFISEKTVKHHMSKIFRKLNIKKRSQLKGIL